MFNSINIANYFILKANEEGCEITPMKVLKLVYIAHGWHLGIKGEPLISDRVEAWKYGPVVPPVYHQFKEYGRSNIEEIYLPTFEDVEKFNSITKNKDIEEFLDTIWKGYKDYTGGQLSDLTHQKGTPWDTTWNKNKGQMYNGSPIPNELIKQYYKTKISG